eukprot:6159457-Pleurochrysis_carterae.AAC.2
MERGREREGNKDGKKGGPARKGRSQRERKGKNIVPQTQAQHKEMRAHRYRDAKSGSEQAGRSRSRCKVQHSAPLPNCCKQTNRISPHRARARLSAFDLQALQLVRGGVQRDGAFVAFLRRGSGTAHTPWRLRDARAQRQASKCVRACVRAVRACVLCMTA